MSQQDKSERHHGEKVQTDEFEQPPAKLPSIQDVAPSGEGEHGLRKNAKKRKVERGDKRKVEPPSADALSIAGASKVGDREQALREEHKKGPVEPPSAPPSIPDTRSQDNAEQGDKGQESQVEHPLIRWFLTIPVSGTIVLGVVILFLIVPFSYAYSITRWDVQLGGIDGDGFFYLLAILPGVIAIGHRALSREREESNRLLSAYCRFRDNYNAERYPSVPKPNADAPTSIVVERESTTAVVLASVVLTSVFLLVAAMADRYGIGVTVVIQKQGLRAVDGLIFCGFGAYVSVMYYMAARMYANALSSRFLATSAIRSASALALGWIFVGIGADKLISTPGTNLAVLFTAGLFHNWAIGYLRSKAMNWFGASKDVFTEMPLGIIEGIEDTTADLLTEHGIASVQHVATADAAELVERTLLPVNRIIDWIDQAILIDEVKTAITPLRASGHRCATSVARLSSLSSHDPAATTLLESAGEKSGLGRDQFKGIAARLAADYSVRFLYEWTQGVPIDSPPPARFDKLLDSALKKYEVVPPGSADPAKITGDIILRPPSPPSPANIVLRKVPPTSH